MELLIDTNIILDIVFGRKGYEVSLELFRIIGRKGFRAYITASFISSARKRMILNRPIRY
ncbi:MAG: hypothetical protein J1E83_13690 [Lachnospiraceae bacterium]|nr:hypothetical protein [Lachnospiraceae bacterium]